MTLNSGGFVPQFHCQRNGTVRVAAGEVMSDGDMLGFDWYVEGAVGKLPK